MKAGDIKRRLASDEENLSPFASIKLVPKKEEEKKTERKPAVKSTPKKPSEIVQGYNPSSSFADILYAYEHTGNPYAMPSKANTKKIAESKTDFGAILDKWEGRSSDKKTAKKTNKPEEKKSTYKPTKSFEDILSAFEGKPIKKTEEAIEKEVVEDIVDDTLFRKETEDEKKACNVSWSIFGGKNEDFVRKEEGEKEPEEESPKEKEPPKRVSERYKATKSFAEILSSFEGKKTEPEKVDISESEVKKEPEEKKAEEILSDNLFRKESDDEKRAPEAVWSVFGNNRIPERKDTSASVPQQLEVQKEENRSAYHATKDFSSILSNYEKKAPEKTFDEIMKEKGEKEKKPQFTISKLRTMLPQATLDLHGYTLDEADKAVKEFLEECQKNHLRKISIITGKGLHSEDGVGVLKDAVTKILNDSDIVSEKNSAPLSAGGSGALWIILKETQRSL